MFFYFQIYAVTKKCCIELKSGRLACAVLRNPCSLSETYEDSSPLRPWKSDFCFGHHFRYPVHEPCCVWLDGDVCCCAVYFNVHSSIRVLSVSFCFRENFPFRQRGQESLNVFGVGMKRFVFSSEILMQELSLVLPLFGGLLLKEMNFFAETTKWLTRYCVWPGSARADCLWRLRSAHSPWLVSQATLPSDRRGVSWLSETFCVPDSILACILLGCHWPGN